METSYSKLFFDKDVYDILEQDVLDFFKIEREENSILEFKSGRVPLEKIYKEVSALHNSQGGLLVIGSPIPQKDGAGKESFFGELTRSNFRSKDWLYQKIYSNISPPPINLKIHDVICSDGGKIQILDIPKSINPPHQDLSNGVYFIRYETETKFAPHGLVEALFNRRKQPYIEVYPSFINENREKEREFEYLFNPKISNKVDVPLINTRFIVEFYNISNVKKENLDLEEKIRKGEVDLIFDRDSTGMISSTLVKGLNIPFNYLIEHYSEPFVSGIFVWGDNMNLQRNYIIVSPLDNKFRIIKCNNGESIELVIENLTDIIESSNENTSDIKGFKNLLRKLKNMN